MERVSRLPDSSFLLLLITLFSGTHAAWDSLHCYSRLRERNGPAVFKPNSDLGIESGQWFQRQFEQLIPALGFASTDMVAVNGK